MAKAEKTDQVPLDTCNKRYRADETEAMREMGGAQRAAHRAIDIAFGRRGVNAGQREQKTLRPVPHAPNTDLIQSGPELRDENSGS